MKSISQDQKSRQHLEATGVHASIDKVAETSKGIMEQVGPMIDRGAEYAHATVDKASNAIKLKGARNCIKTHPLKSVGAAVILGLLVGRLL